MTDRGRELLLTEHRTVASVVRDLLDPLVVGAVLFCLVALAGETIMPRYFVLGLLAMVVVLWTFGVVGLYRSFRSEGVWAELPRLVLGWAYTVALLLFLGFVTGATGLYSGRVLVAWIFSTPLVLGATHALLRLVLRALRVRGVDSRTAVIAGTGALAEAIAERIAAAPWWGIQLLGGFDDEQRSLRSRVALLGSLDELPGFVKSRRVALVYVALPSDATAAAKSLVTRLGDTTASVYFVPDVFLSALTRVAVQNVGGLPALALCETPFANVYYRALKRLSDVLLSSILIALAAIPMAVITLAVKLSSPGPVIFRQRRYGLNGEEIVVYKFRTMRVAEEGAPVKAACRSDPRVTRVGGLLRRFSLDELPQLLNVLQGRMSMVGPRPLAITQNELYRTQIDGYMVRHKVKPGITGWAQINGLRGGDSIDKVRRRVEYDLHYVRNWSPWLDLRIVLRTALVMFHDDNAY